MYTRHICVSAGDRIAEHSRADGGLTKALGGLAEICGADGRDAVVLRDEGGRKLFTAGSYCGFVCFADGTLLEILPRRETPAEARKALCTEFCRRCGYEFREADFVPERNFMEYFISVFAGETMRIIKSGVLSAYTSREENLTTVQGTIMFAENIRRNLVHRERLYVRHDVFTPDRAENRIIKSAALMLSKLTADAHSSHLLMEALSFLGEVAVPHDPAAEFGRCINTRNTRKYAATLSICRMLLDKNEGTALLGKDIICGQVYEMS